jgi:hypothetical protein
MGQVPGGYGICENSRIRPQRPAQFLRWSGVVHVSKVADFYKPVGETDYHLQLTASYPKTYLAYNS